MFGTFWLVLSGCGSAVLAVGCPRLGIGFSGVALAFGLTVLTMAYAIGHISGCHLNPAVSVGLTVAGRFPVRDLVPYIATQVVGGVIGAYVLSVIASGVPGFDLVASGFATNGYGDHSPGHYTMIAIGLCLTLIHLISIPVTNTSVNPARSTGPAFFVGGAAMEQLWLFWVAPVIGAVIAGVVYPSLTGAKKQALAVA
ncbi:MAG: Aquaporin Z [Candidatus Burkholderia crenata]|nr:MAG: Aquaporin Z [Candidatus Burkholderia crenata]